MESNLNKLIENSNSAINIVSGEGQGEGISESYHGKRTLRAIKMRLTKERSGGDRWAKAMVYSHKSKNGINVFIDVETEAYC